MPDFQYLHPMIVHFPIALIIIGFLFDVAGLILKKDWFRYSALLLLLLGTIGVIAAYISGGYAGDGITESGTLKQALERHEDAALITIWIMSITLVVRFAALYIKKYQPVVQGLAMALFLAGVVSIIRTGHFGGELVYKHAAGVTFNFDLNTTEFPDSTGVESSVEAEGQHEKK